MQLIKAANGKQILRITKQEWERIGLKFEESKKKRAKKSKDWDPNPWAVCHKSVGPKKTPKFERCVQHVKDQQEGKKEKKD